jgi:hypothetical protein
VIVEWSQPSGATVTGYVVHYSHGDNYNNIIITECNTTDNNTTDGNMTDSNMTESKTTKSVPASSNHALITNLTECYNYTFSVEATSEHLSGISKTFIFKLGTSDLSVNVTAEAVSSTVISVQWDHLRACSPVSDLSDKFSVKYTAVFSAASEVINQTGELIVTSTEAMLTGLTPYTNYSITVAVVNEMGNVGPYSYPTTNRTLEDVPGPVGAVTASPSPSQVTLTWEPPLMPNGIIIAYEVSYRQTASSEPETRVNSSALATNFTTESNLEEATEFIFSVRAYTRVGPGNATSLTVDTLSVSSTPINPLYYFIIAIASSVTVVVLVCILIIFVCICKKKQTQKRKEIEMMYGPEVKETATSTRVMQFSEGKHEWEEVQMDSESPGDVPFPPQSTDGFADYAPQSTDGFCSMSLQPPK